ncbi:MAG: hypothetical protein NTZ17_11595 [Phycisphaerae bacterium]|nr:hypothetical protein [Phycisphaerae bacterium]
MKEIMATIEIPILALCAAAIFAILFMTILASVKRMSMFGPGASVIVALSVTLLGMVGLYQMFIGSKRGDTGPGNGAEHGLDVCLFPFTALVVAIILTLLLLLARRMLGCRERMGNKDIAGRTRPWELWKPRREPPEANHMSETGSGSHEITSRGHHGEGRKNTRKGADQNRISK